MSPIFRYLISSLVIAAATPVGLATLELEQSAYAKNGGGNGGGQGGGNGGGHGNSGGGNAKGHGKQALSGGDGETGGIANKPAKAELQASTDDDPLSPSALGKLNGVLHASPQAIANASINSPIGQGTRVRRGPERVRERS